MNATQRVHGEVIGEERSSTMKGMCCPAIACNDATKVFVTHVEETVDDFDNIRGGVDNEASFTGKQGLLSQEFTLRPDGECHLAANCVFTRGVEDLETTA